MDKLDKILEILVEHTKRFDRLDERMDKIEQRLDVLEQRFDVLEKRFDDLEQRFNDFKQQTEERFDALEKRFDVLEQRFDALEKRFNELEQKFDILAKRLDELEQKFNNLKQQTEEMFNGLHRSIIIIEDKVSNEIPALFDDNGFQQDHLERNDKDIKQLQNITENHAIRIISLELGSKDLSKQLQNLKSNN